MPTSEQLYKQVIKVSEALSASREELARLSRMMNPAPDPAEHEWLRAEDRAERRIADQNLREDINAAGRSL